MFLLKFRDFFRSGFDRRSTLPRPAVLHGNRQLGRGLRVEHLEQRRLLSVNPGYALGPILPDDLEVSQPDDASTLVDVAFDGDRYLVVWQSPGAIEAQFVLPDGQKDGSPLVLTQPQGRPTWGVNVAFSGTNYLVTYYLHFHRKPGC